MCAYSLEKGSSFLQGILVVRKTEIYAHCPCFQVFITKFCDTPVCRDTAVENHLARPIGSQGWRCKLLWSGNHEGYGGVGVLVKEEQYDKVVEVS